MTAVDPVTVALALKIPIAGRLVDASGSLDFTYVKPVDSSTPPHHPQGRLKLNLGASLYADVGFKSQWLATAGGTSRDPKGPGLFDLHAAFQDRSPNLEVGEAYLDGNFSWLSLRVGIQRFAWGTLLGQQPNDLLNPEKFVDPVLQTEDERKIGVPAAAATLYLPTETEFLRTNLRLSVVWLPIVVPFRLAEADERWFPPLATIVRTSQFMGFSLQNRLVLQNGAVPARRLDNSGVALRVTGVIANADVSLSYFDVFDPPPIPVLDASVDAFVRPDLLNPQIFDIQTEVRLFPLFQRIRAVGADVAFPIRYWTLRAEATYVAGRLFNRLIGESDVSPALTESDLSALLSRGTFRVPIRIPVIAFERDSIEWGVGTSSTRFLSFFLAELNQTVILHNDVDLLLDDHDTRMTVYGLKTFFREKLLCDLIGAYGVQGRYVLANPRVTYKLTDAFDVRVGYVLINGRRESVLGQYRDNGQVYFAMRYYF